MAVETYGADVLGIADELVEAYVEVFTAPPFEHRDPGETRIAFRKRLERDALRDGFQAWIERETCLTYVSAQRYMRVASLVSAKKITDDLFGVGLVEFLKAHATPRTVKPNDTLRLTRDDA